MSLFLVLLCGTAVLAACGGGSGGRRAPINSPTKPGDPQPPGADLDAFDVGRIMIDDQELEVWFARTVLQHQLGFQDATPEQVAPLEDDTRRGMLFIFGDSHVRTFWMLGTYIPLDLAYIRADGTISEIVSMVPLDPTVVASSEPVQYVLEVPAGTFADLGIGVGSTLALPLP